MEADRHHLRAVFALGVQDVERVFQIVEKLLTGIESLRRCKTHVIGIQCVGHHQLRGLELVVPVRQIICIGIRVVDKAAFLGHEAM